MGKKLLFLSKINNINSLTYISYLIKEDKENYYVINSNDGFGATVNKNDYLKIEVDDFLSRDDVRNGISFNIKKRIEIINSYTGDSSFDNLLCEIINETEDFMQIKTKLGNQLWAPILNKKDYCYLILNDYEQELNDYFNEYEENHNNIERD